MVYASRSNSLEPSVGMPSTSNSAIASWPSGGSRRPRRTAFQIVLATSAQKKSGTTSKSRRTTLSLARTSHVQSQ